MAHEFMFTLGQDWVKQFISGMRLLHCLQQQQEVPIVPQTPINPSVVVEILQEVIAGSYQSDKYFIVGEKSSLELIFQPPKIVPSRIYNLLSLNTETARSRLVSVDTGGVAFEDPFRAIFAAQAIAQKLELALPLAKDNMDLWKKNQDLEIAIRQKKYKAESFFGSIDGFSPLGSFPQFSLITIESDQLESLRKRGMQSFMRPPRFFELFGISSK